MSKFPLWAAYTDLERDKHWSLRRLLGFLMRAKHPKTHASSHSSSSQAWFQYPNTFFFFFHSSSLQFSQFHAVSASESLSHPFTPHLHSSYRPFAPITSYSKAQMFLRQHARKQTVTLHRRRFLHLGRILIHRLHPRVRDASILQREAGSDSHCSIKQRSLVLTVMMVRHIREFQLLPETGKMCRDDLQTDCRFFTSHICLLACLFVAVFRQLWQGTTLSYLKLLLSSVFTVYTADCTHAYTHARTHARTHAHTNTHTHACTPNTHTHAHTHTHTHTQMRSHTNTHTHSIYIYIHAPKVSLRLQERSRSVPSKPPYLYVWQLFVKPVGDLGILHGGDVQLFTQVHDLFHWAHDARCARPKHLLHLATHTHATGSVKMGAPHRPANSLQVQKGDRLPGMTENLINTMGVKLPSNNSTHRMQDSAMTKHLFLFSFQ